ncbi:MAG TPA: hypothetical protein VEZ40_07740 [Pyrinomonadaceae bacterium]|nr:hypothetical protein [Pyrinomonadaceae bacterium]
MTDIRDITRVLCVSLNTVLEVIRAVAAQTPEPHPPPRLADVEVDEHHRNQPHHKF